MQTLNGDLTTYMGFYNQDELVTISTLLERYIDDKEIHSEQAVLHHTEGIDLIPANIALATTENNLQNAMNREYAMKNCISELNCLYDYIIIDCMPSLSMVTINALAMANDVIVPVQPQYLSAVGMGNLLNTISKVKRQINKDLGIGGILLTLVDRRTRLSATIKDELKYNYGDIIKIYDTQIPSAIKIAESASRGKSIFIYDKNSNVANAYLQFCKEVLRDDRQKRKNEITKGYYR